MQKLTSNSPTYTSGCRQQKNPRVYTDGGTILHARIRSRQVLNTITDNEQLLMPHLNEGDYLGNTPLNLAIQLNKQNIAHHLIEQGANLDLQNTEKRAPLHSAIEKECFNITVHLLEKGAKFTDEGPQHMAPLKMRSLCMEYTLLHITVKKKSLTTATLVLKAGANPNTPDKNGDTPLCTAMTNRHPEMVRLLLQHGASIDNCDAKGHTSFEKAIMILNYNNARQDIRRRNLNFTRILILAGIETAQGNLNICDKIKNSKVRQHIISYQKAIYKTIRQYRQDINLSDHEVRCILFISFRILPWTQTIYSLPNSFTEAFKELNIQEPLQSLVRLRMQAQLLKDAKKALLSYSKLKDKNNFHWPSALQSSIDKKALKTQIEAVCNTTDQNYKIIQASRAYHKITEAQIEQDKINLSEDFPKDSNGGTRLRTELENIEFADLIRRIHPTGFEDKYFIVRWLKMLPESIAATLPPDLKQCFQPYFLGIIHQNLKSLQKLYDEALIPAPTETNASATPTYPAYRP